MEIKYKLYPYPVLSSYSNDYENSAFDASIDIQRDGYDLSIKFISELNCQSIHECIKSGKAKYVYHLECAQTGFRTVVQTDQTEEKYTLLSKSVSGRLQICPFIVAVETLKAYSSPDFHEDYQGMSFDIEAGCVMAAGKMVIADISMDIDDIAETPSIFNIIKNPDISCKQMLVDMSQRKIVVKLPVEDFSNYKILNNSSFAKPILNSLTIIPALVYVLEELRALSIQERAENSDMLWYKVLSNKLLTQFDCEIESEEFNNQNFLLLAQKLINNPVADALGYLANSFNVEGDDEE